MRRERTVHAKAARVEYGTHVVPSDSPSGPDPVDPVYAALFRPDPEPASPRVSPVDADDDEPMFEQVLDPVVDPRLEVEQPDRAQPAEPAGPAPPAATAHSLVDTGRLFRSQGVADHEAAVLALASDRSGRLRTLARVMDEPVPAPTASAPDSGTVPPAADASAGPSGAAADAPAARRRVGRRSRPDAAAPSHRSRGITGGAVYLIVIGVTVLVGFANALLADGDIGWPTGLALAISSVYCALTVRRADDVVAIITPPLAILVTALTAGQLFLGSAEGSLLNRAVVGFFTLADNWMWVIGSTVAALVIVLVRRRRD